MTNHPKKKNGLPAALLSALKDSYHRNPRENQAVAGITLLTFLLYLPILSNGFLWDDKIYILGNPLIKDFSAGGILRLFTQVETDNYAPVTDLIRLILHGLFGMKAAAFHLFSLLFHLANGILVYLFFKKLTGGWQTAAVTALLFCIHPIQAESVAWASGASNLFSAFFFLLALISYLDFRSERKSSKRYLVLLFFVLAMLSKATAVVLPIILLLIDHYLDGKMGWDKVREKTLFWVPAVVVGLAALWFKAEYGNIDNAARFPVLQRLVFASEGLFTYLLKLVFPARLSAIYPYPIQPGQELPLWHYAALLPLAAFIWFLVFAYKRYPKLFFGLAFFSINLVLVLQLIPIGQLMMADRYAYLPSIGIFFLAAWGIQFLRQRYSSAGILVAAAVIGIFFLYKTLTRTEVWRDEYTLWSDVIDYNENIDYAYNNRANFLLKNRNYDEALQDFDRVIQLNPGVAVAWYNRANVYFDLNRMEKAIGDYSQALVLEPDMAVAMFNRGLAYLKTGQNGLGCDDFRKASGLGYKPAKEALQKYCR